MRGRTGTRVRAAACLVAHIVVQMTLAFALIHCAAGGGRGHVQRRGRRRSVCTSMTGAASRGLGDAGAQHGATQRARAQGTTDVEESGRAVAADHHDAVLGTVHPAVGTLVR